MANLINIINTAAKHMVKLAGDDFDVNKGKLDARDRGTIPGTNQRSDVTSQGAPAKQDNAKVVDQEGLDAWVANQLNKEKMQSALLGGAAGAAGVGGAAYLLAKLLKRKKAWAYGLGGAALGATGGALAAGGALGGTPAVTAIKDYLERKRRDKVTAQTRADAFANTPVNWKTFKNGLRVADYVWAAYLNGGNVDPNVRKEIDAALSAEYPHTEVKTPADPSYAADPNSGFGLPTDRS